VSVINRMLQELESRHEQPQEKLPGMVRAVPPTRNPLRRVLALIAASLLLAVVGGVGYWAWQNQAVRPSEQVPSPPLPIVVVAPPPAAPVPEPPAPVTDAPQAPADPPEVLRQETTLHSTPAPKSAIAEAKHAPRPEPAAHDVPAKPAAPAEPVLRKSAPGVAQEAAGVGIKQVSPAQRADQVFREGLAARGQGRTAEAQAAFEEALKIDPRHSGARQALLGLLLENKSYAQAEAVLRDGLTQNPAQPALAMALARLQVERGDQSAALATLDRYAPQAQDNAEYQGFHAALLQRAERHAEAITRYQAALRLQPGRAVWWMGLGISLQAAQRNAEAAEAFNRARATPGLSPELQAFVEQRLKQLQ
jgi:MSHA biogenesis protein MshN